MTTVYMCLANEHNLALVLVAAFVCLFMSVACSFMLSRMLSSQGKLKIIWLGAVTLIASSGIWTTHFVAMLAYEPGVGFGFDLFWTIASLVLSFIFNAIAFFLISRNAQFVKLAGGAILGVGIGVMHYSGMIGLLPAGIKEWDYGAVTYSIVAGTAFSVLFVWAHQKSDTFWRRTFASLVLVLAICSAHFVGMSALTLIPYPAHTQELLGISASALAIEITLVTFLLIQAGFAALFFDSRLSREREKSAEELRKSEERYALAIQGSSDGILDWDVVNEKLTASEGMIRILGGAATESIEGYLKSIHPEDRQRVRDEFLGDYKGKDKLENEYRIRSKKGDYSWYKLRGKVVRKNSAEITRIVCSITNIDEVVSARIKTQLAQEKTDRANKLKSEFLANMSHELRTPLNGVLGMAQLMERTDLNAKQQKYLNRIHSSGTLLLGIINDVLDISKIEAGLMEIQEEPFDLHDTLEMVVDSISGITELKGTYCKYEVVGISDSIFMGDGKRISQVLVNLAGNAAKFTDEGGINIRVSKDGEENILFSVRDSGPGIAPDQLEVIFERFIQEDGSSTRKHGGTGLGLSISRELVQLMGGEIGVRSELNVGSDFWFKLPLNACSQQLDELKTA